MPQTSCPTDFAPAALTITQNLTLTLIITWFSVVEQGVNGAKFVGYNVLGHNILGQDVGHQEVL